MTFRKCGPGVTVSALLILGLVAWPAPAEPRDQGTLDFVRATTIRQSAPDVSPPLAAWAEWIEGEAARGEQRLSTAGGGTEPTKQQAPQISASIEQTEHGTKATPKLVTSFEGLGSGFEGPQGTATSRNPSDNSLAVGPDHIVQIVNSRMAIFTKKGAKFDITGKVLYGPVNTGNVFKGFGIFGDLNNGDAVVRYDQLADRWLIVMPIFRRLPFAKNDRPGKSGGPVQLSLPGVDGQPGEAKVLYQPKLGEKGDRKREPLPKGSEGSFAMCYAVSTGPDPLGSYYRYVFERPLFPDYPRPAVWPDGYYVPTSTSDDLIQRHAYVAERAKMLKGEPATEQGFVIDDVEFPQQRRPRREATTTGRKPRTL